MQIIIERRGECNRCGYCCQGCIHLVPKFDKPRPYHYKCEIYDKRNEFCEKCGRVHNCADDYPQYPIRYLCPECGYRFYDVQTGAEVIEIRLKDWDFIEKHGN